MRWSVGLGAALLYSCSGHDSFVAELPDLHGLQEGAPVVMAGVAIGTVHGIRIQGAGAVAEFRVRRADHQLELHDDACVAVLPVDGEQTLVLFGGSEGVLQSGQSIPICALTAEDMRELGAYLGGLAGAFGAGVASGCTTSVMQTPLPPPVMPRPVRPPQEAPRQRLPEGSVCDLIRVEVQRIDPPGFTLPGLGPAPHRVWMVVDNDNDVGVELPPVRKVTLGTADGTVLSIDHTPDLAVDDWSMPITIPPRARVQVSVQLRATRDAEPEIGFIEIEGVSARGSPFQTCVVSR